MRQYLFAKITKVDEERREVEGVLAEEAVDKDNEIMDYESSKPYFQKWNSDFAEKTDGKSVGNLRAMHAKIAAGKFVTMTYDDANKQISVVAKVTNDEEWQNVVEGVYTGFSIGARRVGKMWRDKSGAMRWTANPHEGSLVDNPAMYGANFTHVRAAGKVEGKFKGSDETRGKGLYGVGYFAQVVAMLQDLVSMCDYEEEYEDDENGRKICAQIRKEAEKLGDLLVRYTEAEVNELKQNEEKTMSKTAEAGVRPAAEVPATEAGVRPAAPAAPVVEKVVAAPAASVPAAEPLTADAVQKMISTSTEKVTADFEKKLADQKTDFEGKLKESNDALEAANKAMGDLVNRPAKTPVNVKGNVVVSKEKDATVTSEGDGEKVGGGTKDPIAMAKAIHAAGPGVRHAV